MASNQKPVSPARQPLTGHDQKRHIHQALKFLHPGEGAVFEIRALGPSTPKSRKWEGYAGGEKGIVSGWFNDPIKATEKTAALDAIGFGGIYVTLNPVNPALLARADNRLKAAKVTTSDKDILALRRLLIDIDPKRPSGISSTDEEHHAALKHAEWVRQVLSGKGFPDPLYGDSGNGAHLVYQLPDLENTEENVTLLRDTLNALNDLYRVAVLGRQDYIHLEIDSTVFNSARISKLYGTFARKGDSTPDRPHRQAQIIDFPKEPQPVAVELLRALIASVPKDKRQDRSTTSRNTQGQNNGSYSGKFDLAGYLEKYGVTVRQVKQHGGSTLYVLETCLFDETHTGGEAAIGQAEDGKLFYQCFHDSCKKMTWHDARAKISGNDLLGQFMEGYNPFQRQGAPSAVAEIQAEVKKQEAWARGRDLFPRTPFPWDVFPPAITESLQQLARSCATSSDHLPGISLSIMASVLGRALSITPKASWREPLILWVGDIRPSGEGKTPAARMLLKIVEKAQIEEHRRYKAELAAYEQRLTAYKSLPKKEQDPVFMPKPPKRERGHYLTDLTLEGLRAELEDHPTGGLAVCQDELSSFVSSQNQYKSKGNDRETWLKLHDGNPARIGRADRTILLHGARISLFGGIQPGVFRMAFCSDEGVYLEDGSVFRFLFTYERLSHYDLTGESWSDENRALWETLHDRAMEWARGKLDPETGSIEEPFVILLGEDAQSRFFDWRNSLHKQRSGLHPILQGFLPKAYGYALRLAALIHALWRFHDGASPNRILTIEDIDRGIGTAEFHLGQTVDAMQLIEDPEHCPASTSERVKHLAETLEALRSEVDSARLAVGFIQERFNEGMPKEKQIGSAKAMGALLKASGLTVSETRHRANGRVGAYCLAWDEKTETFLKQSSTSSLCSQDEYPCGFAGVNFKNQSSTSSTVENDGANDLLNLMDFVEPSSTLPSGVQSTPVNIVNVEDFVSNQSEHPDPEEPEIEFEEGTL